MANNASETNERKVTRSAITVASGTLVSRILGALRDAVIAATFSLVHTDAFFIAFTIPNSLRVLLGEGAISAAFVPVLSQTQSEGPKRYQEVFSKLFGLMALILSGVTIVGIVLAPAIVSLYATGYLGQPDKFALTVELTRWVFPYILLMGLAALATASLHTFGLFSIPAFSPSLLNLALIGAALTLPSWLRSTHTPAVIALALGAVAGGVLQVAIQIPALAKRKVLTWPRVDLNDPAIRKALTLLFPLILGLGTYQLNIIASRMLASFLPTGAQSYLYYSQRLVEIPQGMIALAIGSAALPTLSSLVHQGRQDQAKTTLAHAWRLSLFLTLPASLFLFALSEATVAVILGRGRFDAHQIHEAASALRAQALGVWAISSVRVLIPLFHANGDTRSPIKASMLNLTIFVAASVTLMQFWQHTGIAFAITLAGIAQLIALILLSKRSHICPSLGPVLRASAKIVACALPAVGLLFYADRTLHWAEEGGSLSRILIYLALLAAGGLLFVLMAYFAKVEEAKLLVRALDRRNKTAG